MKKLFLGFMVILMVIASVSCNNNATTTTKTVTEIERFSTWSTAALKLFPFVNRTNIYEVNDLQKPYNLLFEDGFDFYQFVSEMAAVTGNTFDYVTTTCTDIPIYWNTKTATTATDCDITINFPREFTYGYINKDGDSITETIDTGVTYKFNARSYEANLLPLSIKASTKAGTELLTITIESAEVDKGINAIVYPDIKISGTLEGKEIDSTYTNNPAFVTLVKNLIYRDVD